MHRLHNQAALHACINDDLEAIQHLIPSLMSPNSRIENVRIGDRPYSTVPFLCVCSAYGSLQCFDYLIEKGATAYFADLVKFKKLYFDIFQFN